MANTYIFSISYQAGCYRHIRISQDAKLSTLHDAIADAFGLKDGRMHVFFMNNCAWDNTCGYYCTSFPKAKILQRMRFGFAIFLWKRARVFSTFMTLETNSVFL